MKIFIKNDETCVLQVRRRPLTHDSRFGRGTGLGAAFALRWQRGDDACTQAGGAAGAF